MIGGQEMQSQTKHIGDVNDGEHPVDLRVGPMSINDEERVVFNFQVVNSGLKDQDRIDALLTDLEDYALYSPSTPVLRGISDDISREPLGLLVPCLLGEAEAREHRLDASVHVFRWDSRNKNKGAAQPRDNRSVTAWPDAQLAEALGTSLMRIGRWRKS
jgi:hypothetical protein